MCKWFIWEVEQIKSDLRELVAMTLCIRDEVIEYVMGHMFEDIITMNNNYERGKWLARVCVMISRYQVTRVGV